MKTPPAIGRTLRALLEHRRSPAPALPPLPTFHGGRLLVDIANRDALMFEDEVRSPDTHDGTSTGSRG